MPRHFLPIWSLHSAGAIEEVVDLERLIVHLTLLCWVPRPVPGGESLPGRNDGEHVIGASRFNLSRPLRASNIPKRVSSTVRIPMVQNTMTRLDKVGRQPVVQADDARGRVPRLWKPLMAQRWVSRALISGLGMGLWGVMVLGGTVLSEAQALGAGPAAPAAPAVAPANTAPAKSAPASTGLSLEQAVNKVQGSYAKFESFRADFTQTLKAGAMGKPRVDTGVVELKKGGRMHWEFKTPDARHFISDGKTLWIYTPADKQAISTPPMQESATVALNFMAGLGDLSRDFKVSLATEPEFQKAGMVALHLMPKEQLGSLKRLTVLASEADGQVKEAVMADQMGGVTRMEFLNVQMNGKIEDARFQFVAPPGVTVIPAGG